MHLTFGNRLSYQSWTRALSDLPLRGDSAESWNTLLENEEIQIDLSNVGFADFIILGRRAMFDLRIRECRSDYLGPAANW